MRSKFILAAVVLLAGCVGAGASFTPPVMGETAAAAAQDGGRAERQFNVGSGKRLTVDLKTGGEIDISGWDNDTVTVGSSVSGENAADADLSFNETPAGCTSSRATRARAAAVTARTCGWRLRCRAAPTSCSTRWAATSASAASRATCAARRWAARSTSRA